MRLCEWMVAADLAPGDSGCLLRDWSGLDLHRIRSADDPRFTKAFAALWREFHGAGEIEQADVLAERLGWDPAKPRDGVSMLYELLLLESEGRFVAVRDHTVILIEGMTEAVVHLSHVLVDPAWRRSGLAGWLRALPVSGARRALAAAGRPVSSPVTLVAEMEFADAAKPATLVRLGAYERAGYRKVAGISYFQPDFRAPAAIDAAGGPVPLPLSLIVRRIGREEQETADAAEIRSMVEAIYTMYGRTFRASEMAQVFETLSVYPEPGETVRLVRPTES